MRSRTLAVSLGLFVTATSSVAFGETSRDYPAACDAASVPPSVSEAAHSSYKAGRLLYDQGGYALSVSQFRESYRRDCSKHELLVIISRAYELSDNRREAVRALELFLERVKDSPEAPSHRIRIANLKREIAAEPPPPSPPVPNHIPQSKDEVPPPPPERRQEHTALPWVLVGLGGAAAVAGVVVFATAPKLPKGCDADTQKCTRNTNETEASYQDRQSDAGRSQSQPTVGVVVASGGLALVVGGLLWHLLEPSGPVTSSRSLKPVAMPGYAGLSFGQNF